MEKLTTAPEFVSDLAAKINELVDVARKVEGLSAGSGINITIGDSGIVIESTGGDGLPTGYGPESWTVYDGGVVTTRNFLTDNPD